LNDPQVFENPCAICRKKIATKYCDFVYKLHMQAELPKELKKDQRRAKTIIYRQLMEEHKLRGE